MRDAEESDTEGIMRVHTDCILKVCSSHYSQDQVQRWAQAQTLQRYASLVSRPDHFVLVVERGDSKRVVGFGHMGRSEGRFSPEVDFEIYSFYVSPAVSRRGVGRMLYAELERRALRQGGCGIGVKSSLNAVPFYEACGFVGDGGAGVGVHMGGGVVELECKSLEKKLDQDS